MKTRHTKPRGPCLTLSLLAFTFAAGLVIVVFLPHVFIVNRPARLPHTFRGFPVVRYGYSRLGQQCYASNIDRTCSMIRSSRSFVDIVDSGRVRRVYGWRLSRKVNPSRPAITITVE
jgi:hypothetical protein